MRRREFVSTGVAALIGHNYKSYTDTWSTDGHYTDTLIHKRNSEPAVVVPNSGSSVTISVPDTIDGDCILLAENKYGEPNMQFQTHKIPIEDGVYNLTEPQSDSLFAYTMYAKDDDSYEYIGESLPLYWTGSRIVEREDSLDLSARELENKSRSVEIGYYEISTFNSPSVRVSQQLRNTCSQEYGYGNSQDAIQESPFCEHIASRILSEIHNPTTSRRLRELTDFVQNSNWTRDKKSSGYINYIRNPVATVSNGFGDCEDTTLLLNGLIENSLGIRTALIFSQNHVCSGINKKDTLDKSDESEFSEVQSYTHGTGEYIPIETTTSLPIGDLHRDPFLIYRDNRYRILSINGVLKHYLPI